jgi:predicted ArsR family transcriptional regulator
VKPGPPEATGILCHTPFTGGVEMSRKSDRLRVFYFLVVHPDPISAANLSEKLDLNQRDVVQHLTILHSMGFLTKKKGGSKRDNPSLWQFKSN